ncbi:MAG: matrixin family metalloprotease [Microthrixaceae bacterium]
MEEPGSGDPAYEDDDGNSHSDSRGRDDGNGHFDTRGRDDGNGHSDSRGRDDGKPTHGNTTHDDIGPDSTARQQDDMEDGPLGDDPHRAGPFDDGFGPDADFIFDDDFVRAAEIKEPTAAERQRAVRQANLQRLLDDREAQQENLLHEYRRFAPLPGDADSSGDDEGPYDYSDEYFNYDAGHFGEAGPDHEDEWLLGLDQDDYDLWVSQRRQRRNRRVLAVVSVVVIISVLFVYALAQFFAGLSIRNSNSANGSRTPGTENTATAGSRSPGDPRDADTGAATRPDDWPPLADWPLTPLGTPATVPSGGGPHAFIKLQADGSTPVAYDPCRVIHYVTHGQADAPDSAGRLVSDALRTVSELTGLVFVDDGPTDEVPSDNRAAYQPDRYGEHWAPVLISWSTATESPRLGVSTPEGSPPGSTVDVLGYAGSVSAGFTPGGTATVHADEPKGLALGPVSSAAGRPDSPTEPGRSDGASTTDTSTTDTSTADTSGTRIYVTGSLVLDRENFAGMLGEFDGYARARATVLHELGHLVGLNHVDDPGQLMAPMLQGSQTEFAAGDKEGLAALGKGACVPAI